MIEITACVFFYKHFIFKQGPMLNYIVYLKFFITAYQLNTVKHKNDIVFYNRFEFKNNFQL